MDEYFEQHARSDDSDEESEVEVSVLENEEVVDEGQKEMRVIEESDPGENYQERVNAENKEDKSIEESDNEDNKENRNMEERNDAGQDEDREGMRKGEGEEASEEEIAKMFEEIRNACAQPSVLSLQSSPHPDHTKTCCKGQDPEVYSTSEKKTNMEGKKN